MAVLITFSFAMLGYVYVGYPVLLRILVRLRGAKPVRRGDALPSVSLVISAYNEASVMRRKLENALALTYPAKLLEVVVVSDASDDSTDAIVREYADRGVRLSRQPERRGKTAGLNRTVPTLSGDIVAFSDANALYQPDALLKLVRNFADPHVGCVTGEARYLVGARTAADVGERVYWGYEIHIKRLETALDSMVGGDGAIYAIRRSLWRELPQDAINDFLNPLQIVAAGWRAVYEPEAICYEETAGGMRSEYRRRVRIVSRSWRAVFQARGVLNPVRLGLFAWCIFSHKVLRWVSGVFVLVAMIGAGSAFVQALLRWPLPSLLASVGVVALASWTRAGRGIAAMGVYYAVIHVASLEGVLKGSLGRVSGVWATPRQTAERVRRPQSAFAAIGSPLLLTTMLLVLAAAVVGFGPSGQSAERLFWTSSAVLAYIYLGYPALLAVVRPFAMHPVRCADIQPQVCVFIPANDEAAVLEAKLQNTLALEYPAACLQIVVASDGSVDGTNAIVGRFQPFVRLLEFSPRRGKIATINDGISAVTSDIIVFSDANTFLEPNALRALVRSFADPEVGAVSGDVRLEGERAALGRAEDLYYRYERWMQAAESTIGSMVGVDGAFYAIRHDLFVPPPSDTILDDMAIPMAIIRAGRRVVFEPAARAHERGSDSAKEEFARKSRVIAGAVQFLSRYDSVIPLNAVQVMFSMVSHKALRWLSPLLAACAFAASAALAPTSAAYAAAAVGQGALLLLGAAGCIPALRRASLVGLAHYFCLVQIAAGFGFVRGLRGSQSVRWRRFNRVPVELA